MAIILAWIVSKAVWISFPSKLNSIFTEICLLSFCKQNQRNWNFISITNWFDSIKWKKNQFTKWNTVKEETKNMAASGYATKPFFYSQQFFLWLPPFKRTMALVNNGPPLHRNERIRWFSLDPFECLRASSLKSMLNPPEYDVG